MDGATVTIVPVGSTRILDVRVSFSADHLDVRQAIRNLMKQLGGSYEIDPAVQGTVTIPNQTTTVRNFLDMLTGPLNAKWSSERGVIVIKPVS
jgi:type II secretory pathway component GspD/PulD (secretin)